MKRMICIICCLTTCLLSVLGLTGCAEQKPTGTPVSVYYLSKSVDTIDADVQYLENDTTLGQIEEVKELLGRTPEDGHHIASWGIDYSIEAVNLEKGNLLITVDENYRKLNPIKEVLIRASLVRSFAQIKGVDFVTLQIGEEALTDSNGTPYGAMNADSFIDNAGNEINIYEKVRLKLYLANEAGDGLVEVNRNVVYNTNISMDKLVVEQIIAGGDSQVGYSSVSSDTKLINVSTMDGTCYVNLSEGFLQPPGNVTAAVSIYSIVNSLSELPNVARVQILVNGEQAVSVRDTISLDTPFERNLELVASPE